MIARVFPTRTSASPTDVNAFFDAPTMFCDRYDEVHISTTFTWDIERAKWLKMQWERVSNNVKLGGPAFGAKPSEFTPGMYLKDGYVMTSRGCPNNCSFCFVPKREGKIMELKIHDGNNILDNNLTACSKAHIDSVFRMLQNQHEIQFTGGLESRRIDDYFVEKLRSLRIKQIFLAYDVPNAEKPLIRSVRKLSKYFPRYKIRCYVLIGTRGDTIKSAEERLKRVWEIGCIPYAMLYRDEKNKIRHSTEWRQFARKWMLPAIIKSIMKTEVEA